uniref:Pheromone binding protein 13 n=1 Tax=Cyrtotrachelus buqueti TaxID=1892066 RepID=A0A1L3KPT1_9CUCU|nr:pheromone binding protein 13 [Cyrtotrachelus buqueti]
MFKAKNIALGRRRIHISLFQMLPCTYRSMFLQRLCTVSYTLCHGVLAMVVPVFPSFLSRLPNQENYLVFATYKNSLHIVNNTFLFYLCPKHHHAFHLLVLQLLWFLEYRHF